MIAFVQFRNYFFGLDADCKIDIEHNGRISSDANRVCKIHC